MDMGVHANGQISASDRHPRGYDHTSIRNMGEPTYPKQHVSTKGHLLHGGSTRYTSLSYCWIMLLSAFASQEASKALQPLAHPSQTHLARAVQPIRYI